MRAFETASANATVTAAAVPCASRERSGRSRWRTVRKVRARPAKERMHIVGDPIGVAFGEQADRLGVHLVDGCREARVDHSLLILFVCKRISRCLTGRALSVTHASSKRPRHAKPQFINLLRTGRYPSSSAFSYPMSRERCTKKHGFRPLTRRSGYRWASSSPVQRGSHPPLRRRGSTCGPLPRRRLPFAKEVEGGGGFMTGTQHVTVLFPDLVGSTELSSSLSPEAADEVRRAHFAVLREAISANGGNEVKTTGDGLMVGFDATAPALSCAVAMQQGIERDNRKSSVVRAIRIGISTGAGTVEKG